MPENKRQDYCKALRQAINAASSGSSLKDKLTALTRITSRCFGAGSAIALLDATGSRLIHSAHSRLPPSYIHKGLIDARKSLNETSSEEIVCIQNAASDPRVEYPESAAKAGIVSIVGVPILTLGRCTGALRVYFQESASLTAQDTSFLKAVAQLAGMTLARQPEEGMSQPKETSVATKPCELVNFAHPSEAEFARILDFYGVPWFYEPRSFPIGRVIKGTPEMFTPDFYLPSFDLYVELTTMKQSLVTQKNRKLRRLKELFPEIKISLLYKNDYERLLAKYGVGPLAETRAHGVSRILYSAPDIEARVKELAGLISADYRDRRPVLLGVQRGFLCFMADLIRQITVPMDLDFIAINYYGGTKEAGVRVTKDADLNLTGRHILLVEDIVDTGITLNYVLEYLKSKNPRSLAVCALLDRRARRLMNIELNYVGFEVPDEFVIGYGLDYHEEYRNLPFIAVPKISGPEKAGS
ncbi:hypoxanthine phosphoribosyltransferase [Dehalogenimonas alkenigignens]|uniref:Hypoxanthine-guanine phosphoribosyltransferase n=1 Tax=Dehalogenimonas alkenigignens TaxID=1217799 RepID=A0A0W0GKY1_9CHLR|nr:hypoxanthine phosphoribosyltransferase [Dehalogenimonas alkenigignens]KTB49215.1 hypoxanthine phosphoribosyltransferase [Dehalogenimonas alkenigignens]